MKREDVEKLILENKMAVSISEVRRLFLQGAISVTEDEIKIGNKKSIKLKN